MMNNFPPPPDEPIPVIPRDIEAKRSVPLPRKAPTVRSGKASIFGKASIPSVYWAGDDPTPLNGDEYTFYREGTPPPDEKGAAASAGYARKRGLSLYDEERRARQERRQRKCCGLRMWVFWLLVALIILVVLGVGVGVGVGVGLGGGSKSNEADGGAARTSSATPTRTSGLPGAASGTPMASPTAVQSGSASPSTTLATSTRTSSTASSSPTATSGPNALCPDADNTVYSPTGSDKRFLRVCGIDYIGETEAIDMSNMLAKSMGECMDICSKTAQCTAAGWGNVTTTQGTMELRCWLKRDLKSSHEVKEGWNFAILL
ncbi:uncharacterized protein CTRU02_205147 [Colletotrichum truncatum]|uniref:Uncharacterized protein n=1 Tax=Colletotrichum truncatum TaxID=5467 RepID=A0ACC3Z387_COLTU|nr:uncharacterized protein CTRU02_06031 [Colletotrichum truncatum]KAF6793159.1 hypothetical protein CTRU02_06031 [Colletotrichum truncatum]